MHAQACKLASYGEGAVSFNGPIGQATARNMEREHFPLGAASEPPALPLRELQVVPSSQGARAGRAGQTCACLVPGNRCGCGGYRHRGQDRQTRTRPPPLHSHISVRGVLPLPQLTFPPDWRPDINGGGFRAGGGLVAYLCDGYFRVGNPLHNLWEKVKSEGSTLRFKRKSFALVVDECAGSYEIVAYGMNDPAIDSRNPLSCTIQGRPRDDTDRDHDNWVIQVYSSKSRAWRAGAALDHQVFQSLCDVCVFEGTVCFLGWIEPPNPRPRRRSDWYRPSDDPAVQELERQDFKSGKLLGVWAYNLDSSNLREVVPLAQFHGGPGKHWNFPDGSETCGGSLQLLVSGRKPSSPQFNLVVAASVCNDYGCGPFWEKLFRLRLDEKDPSLRFWVTEDVVGLDELVAGGPKAALVADTWGVDVVAYTGFDLFRPQDIDENPYPWGTLRILCYHRDEQKWMDWYGYEPREMAGMNRAAAVGFVACECCRGELTSAGPFDHIRSIPWSP